MTENCSPHMPFHLSFDLYEDGKTINLLVLPCNETFIVVKNDEHVCTLVKTFDEPDYWEQHSGCLKEEIIEKIGAAISKRNSLF